MANDTPKTYYRVAVSHNWLVDSEGRYIRDSFDFDCGHNHRTEATAEACRQKLLNWDREHKHCSAKWYNSQIYRTDAEGRHIPEAL